MGEALEVSCPSQRGTTWRNTAVKSRGHPGSVRQELAPGFVSYSDVCFRAPTGTKHQDCLEQLLLPNVALETCAGGCGVVGGGKRHQSKSVLFPASVKQPRNPTLPFLPKLQRFPAASLLYQPAPF